MSDLAAEFTKRAYAIKYPSVPPKPQRTDFASGLLYGGALDEWEAQVAIAKQGREDYDRTHRELDAEFEAALAKDCEEREK